MSSDGREPSPPGSIGFRLFGQVADSQRSFLLQAGENPIGSADSCHVALPAHGVSRRHAVLSVTPGGLTLRDEGSKNGTFVNGRPIRESPVRPGDEIRLGPVRLSLEEVDAEEAVLGLVVDAGEGAAPAGPPTRETSLFSQDERALGHASFGLVNDVLDRLTTLPEPDLAGTLTLLARSIGAEAAALVEWPRSARPVVVAATAAVGHIPSRTAVLEARKSRHDSRARFLLFGPPPATAAVRTPGVSSPVGLVVWGDFPGRRNSALLLEAVLRLVVRFQPRVIDPLEASSAAPDDELPFPEHLVRGESPAMVSLYQQVRLLRQGDVPVLIQGETGVGKEHLARLIHDSSRRGREPFVAVNCAAIPADLLEAEMFGVGRGVATGVERRSGKLLAADGGTVFLDEIADMSTSLQAKLLRALQEKEIHPLGEAPIRVDVRVVAATNARLRRRIEEGRFREDLYYRLAGYVLEVPPLRERSEDLQRLLAHFIRLFGAETGKTVRGVSVKALRALAAYPWPGNVRELEHEVRRLVYMCAHNQAIDSSLLSERIARRPPDEDEDDVEPGSGLERQLGALERRLIRQALARAAGNQSRAARSLQVSRNGLAKRIKRLGIQVDEFRA